MTRAEQTTVPEPVELDSLPAAPTDSSGTAARVATAAALGLVQGSGTLAKGGATAVGYLVGQALALAKVALTRQRRLAELTEVEIAEIAEIAGIAPRRRGRRLRRAAIFGALGAAVIGGVVFWWSRRGEPAPVSDQPPSLRDVESDGQALSGR
ncbi:hypothetical protein ACFYVR_21610 [Rhodococcus sp. NPDC003318]|uniref:hypothetical protein n=1 Tax=Rhodococcus sp. NPDC003318 TaxID=3364503 RepID=UPI0036B4050B